MTEPVFTPVKSSNVREVGRCDAGRLYVRFHNGGLYRWNGQAEAHHAAMLATDSPGRYMKNLPRGERV